MAGYEGGVHAFCGVELEDEDIGQALKDIGFEELTGIEELTTIGSHVYKNDFGLVIKASISEKGYYIGVPDYGVFKYCKSSNMLQDTLNTMPLDIVPEDPMEIVSHIYGVDGDDMFTTEKTVYHRMVNKRDYEKKEPFVQERKIVEDIRKKRKQIK